MQRLLIAYFAALLAFCLIDVVWLTLTHDFYQAQLAGLLRADAKLGAAVLFYLIYLLGLVVLAVLPGVEQRSWQRCAGLSALFGLCCYATYGLTNFALLKSWPLKVTLIDLAWGTTLSTAAGLCSYWVTRKVLKQ